MRRRGDCGAGGRVQGQLHLPQGHQSTGQVQLPISIPSAPCQSSASVTHDGRKHGERHATHASLTHVSHVQLQPLDPLPLTGKRMKYWYTCSQLVSQSWKLTNHACTFQPYIYHSWYITTQGYVLQPHCLFIKTMLYNGLQKPTKGLALLLVQNTCFLQLNYSYRYHPLHIYCHAWSHMQYASFVISNMRMNTNISSIFYSSPQDNKYTQLGHKNYQHLVTQGWELKV